MQKRKTFSNAAWITNCQLTSFTLSLCPSLCSVNGARLDVLSVNHLCWTHVPCVICSPGAFYFFSFLNCWKTLKKTLNSPFSKMSGIQILAFLGGLVGLGATFCATLSNEWRTTSRASSVITATWVLQGLWNNCAGNAIGALHCRPHHTIFKLEGRVRRVPPSTSHRSCTVTTNKGPTCGIILCRLTKWKTS